MEGLRYAAAREAALAAAAAADEAQRTAFIERALTWLRDDIAARRALAAEPERGVARPPTSGLDTYLSYVRSEDPGLAVLRDLPAFKAPFETPENPKEDRGCAVKRNQPGDAAGAQVARIRVAICKIPHVLFESSSCGFGAASRVGHDVWADPGPRNHAARAS